MQCISCQSEIDPKWTHAIDNNKCPFCGQEILNPKLKDLLSSLRQNLEALQEFPEQLADWILSNYQFIKTNSEKLIDYVPRSQLREYRIPKEVHKEGDKFVVKVKNEVGEEEEVIAEKIQDKQDTNDFFKRAGVTRKNESVDSVMSKTAHLKSLAQQIKKSGVTGIDIDGSEVVAAPMNPVDYDDPMAAELSQAISGVNSAFGGAGDVEDQGGDEIPAAVLAMASRGKGQSASNNSDLAKLQQLRNKAQGGLNSGRGSFSRSGG